MLSHDEEHVLKFIYKCHPYSRYMKWELKKSQTIPHLDMCDIFTIDGVKIHVYYKEEASNIVSFHNDNLHNKLIPTFQKQLSDIYKTNPESKSIEWSVERAGSDKYCLFADKSLHVYGENKRQLDFLVKLHNESLVSDTNYFGKYWMHYTEEVDYKIEGEIKMNNVKKVWIVMNTSEVVGSESIISIASTEEQAKLDLAEEVLSNPSVSYDCVELFSQEVKLGE